MTKKMTPEDFLARNNIEAKSTETGWTLSCASRELFIPADFKGLELRDGGRRWTLAASDEAIHTIRNGKDFWMPFSAAEMTCRWDEYGALGGYRFTFTEFRSGDDAFDFSVSLFCALNWQTGDAQVELMVREEGRDRVCECAWPGGFTGECTGRTVFPFRQGMLIPRDWPVEIKGNGDCVDAITGHYVADTRVLAMPWWGIENAGAAAMMIIDTPDDFGFVFHHPAGGPTQLETRFLPSLGHFRYTRKLLFKMFEKGNYVTMCHAYRNYLKESGKFVSLDMKMARTPVLRKMIGSAILHCGLLYDWMEGTLNYDAEHPEKSKILTPARTIVEQLEKLYENGLRNAYLHLDGWGYRGYDALEPDAVPIGPEAGGEEGLLAIERQCHEQEFLFALHQQYRDNYPTAASYDEKRLFQHKDGSRDFHCFWCGGTNGLMCSSFAPEYVRRNNRYFESIGLKIDGSYLDVFSVTPMDECYDPDHPVTRTECKANRAECFAYIKETQGIVSSEEAIGWAMPFLDLVHHAPYSLSCDGKCAGIPAPLFALVYHDSLLTPWEYRLTTRGGGYMPADRFPALCAMLHCGVPYIAMDATADDIKAAEPARELHRRCATMAMIDHAFLSDDYLEERSVFEDGTTVTVNHRTGSWDIRYPDK